MFPSVSIHTYLFINTINTHTNADVVEKGNAHNV